MRLTHINKQGSVKMVNIGAKQITHRRATTMAQITMQPATLKAISDNKITKGNVLESARLAGIMAAKMTHQLIPLCHPIEITNVKIDFKILSPKKAEARSQKSEITIYATVEAMDRTGVEMEALTAAAVTGLTIYDMCKALDRGMIISEVKLLEKSGGRSGHYKRN
jgi:cyclic pyranopterin monophosphate synthase